MTTDAQPAWDTPYAAGPARVKVGKVDARTRAEGKMRSFISVEASECRLPVSPVSVEMKVDGSLRFAQLSDRSKPFD